LTTSVPESGWIASAVERDVPLPVGTLVVLRPVSDPDRDLVIRAADGDRAAFEGLLRRHYDGIHRAAWRLARSRADADDITQEVCCTLVEKIATFKGEAKFKTWLMGIVVNACRDHYRRRASWTRTKDRLLVLVGLDRAPDGRDADRRIWLQTTLAKLDDRLRETIVLVGEGLTHGEAAHALGVAESTVSSRMLEARRKLSEGGS
jgi:RNA polymerase sigma-70 factor (ECF subfamily)